MNEVMKEKLKRNLESSLPIKMVLDESNNLRIDLGDDFWEITINPYPMVIKNATALASMVDGIRTPFQEASNLIFRDIRLRLDKIQKQINSIR
jgi:hypothetical protein